MSQRFGGVNPEETTLLRRRKKQERGALGIFLSLLWVVVVIMLIFLIWTFVARVNLSRFVQQEAEDADMEMALRIANDTVINETLANETINRQVGDQALSDRIDDVLDVSLGKIKSINGVHSNLTTMDLLLLVDGPGGLSILNDDVARTITLTDDGVSDVTAAANSGLTVTKDTSNSVEVDSAAVLSIESQLPNGVSKNIDFTGTGGIIISTVNASSNEVIVDGGVLELAVNNLNMENQQQSMRLDDQEDTDEDLQMQIDALRQAGEMLQAVLNGTTITFNMTLIELMSTVYMLKDQVADLEAQLANSTGDFVQVGTIVPYGGELVPMGYLKCDGAKYPIANYSALYSVIGDTYCLLSSPCALDEFAVPDMRGRTAVGMDGGSANFGTTGQQSGAETVTLMTTQIPSHTHTTASAGSHSHTTASAGTHSHGGSTGSAGSHNHDSTDQSVTPPEVTSAAGEARSNGGISRHTHSFEMGRIQNTVTGGATIPNGEANGVQLRCTGNPAPVTCNTVGSHTFIDVENPDRAGQEVPGGAALEIFDDVGADPVQDSASSDHRHAVYLNTDGDHTHTLSINNAGSHTHTVNAAGAHTHTINAAGGSEAHPNVQPSLTVGLFAIKF